MRPKRPNPGNQRPAGPLDDKARELAAEEAKIHEEIARRKRLIEEAPARAKELERRRREELVVRASRTDARPGSRVALPDRRYELNAAIPARQKGLRAESRRERLTCFALFAVALAVAYWLYFTWTQS